MKVPEVEKRKNTLYHFLSMSAKQAGFCYHLRCSSYKRSSKKVNKNKRKKAYHFTFYVTFYAYI